MGWLALTERGRQVYGDAWDAPTEEGGVPLGTLFAMHKNELQQVQQEVAEELPPWERAKFEQLTSRSSQQNGDSKAPWMSGRRTGSTDQYSDDSDSDPDSPKMAKPKKKLRNWKPDPPRPDARAWGGQSVFINP